MGVFSDVWPVFLRRHDVSKTTIGLVASLSWAWSLKMLWSPAVDRYGDARHWIAAALCVMAAALGVLGVVEPGDVGPVLLGVLALYCVASATQDIAIDGYTIGLTPRGFEGPVTSVRVAAYRIGTLAAGTGLLFLPRWIGWSGTFTSAALASLAMAAAALCCPRVTLASSERANLLPALSRWLKQQPGARGLLTFILLYRIGDLAMGPMVKPFWVDAGFDNEQIGLYANGLGQVATLVGALIGGAVVTRWGIARSLFVLGVLALGSNFAYALVALLPTPSLAAIVSASLIESVCSGLAGVGFVSFLIRITDREHAAAHYALLSAIYAVSRPIVSAPSGWLTEQLGYPTYFALTAVLALPAFFFLPGACAWLGDDPASVPPRASASRPADASTPREPRPDSPPPRGR